MHRRAVLWLHAALRPAPLGGYSLLSSSRVSESTVTCSRTSVPFTACAAFNLAALHTRASSSSDVISLIVVHGYSMPTARSGGSD